MVILTLRADKADNCGGVPQLVRGPGSYPGRRRFESDLRYQNKASTILLGGCLYLYSVCCFGISILQERQIESN